MAPWLHGTLYVDIHEAKNVPIDRIIRMPDKVTRRGGRNLRLQPIFDVLVQCKHSQSSYLPICEQCGRAQQISWLC